MQKKQLKLYQLKIHTVASCLVLIVCIFVSIQEISAGQSTTNSQSTIQPLSPQGKLSFSDFPSPNTLTFKWRARDAKQFTVEVSSLLGFPPGKNTIRLNGKLNVEDVNSHGGSKTYSLVIRNRTLNKIVRIARANGDIVFWRVVGREVDQPDNNKWDSRIKSHKSRGQTVKSNAVMAITPDSEIVLTSPEHRTAVQNPESLTFNWQSMITGDIRILISADTNFPKGKATLKFKTQSGQNSVSISGKKLEKVIFMAESNDNTVYWKAIGRDLGTRLDVESTANKLYINLINQLPIANAGSDQEVSIGDLVSLDGSASFDPDGDPITFEWSFVSLPQGSSASLSITDPPGPSFATFIADVEGDYVVQLIVDDGKQSGIPDFVTINAQLPFATADAGPDQLNVGFGVLIQLDGSASQPSGGGGALTYLWEQILGPPINLIDADTATPSFVTPTINELQDFEDKERWRVAHVASKDAKFAFRLTVTDEKGVSDNDEVVVSMSESPMSGLQNVGVGTRVFLNGATQPAYQWVLTVPGGSAAVLSGDDTRSPSFVPDVIGTYTVTETNSNQAIIINAAKWVGVGGVGGTPTNSPQCRACHDGGSLPDKITGWQGTGHATFFERAIDGAFPGYQISCVKCHTVGYDSSETAVNDGFDDAVSIAGWQFPSVLEQGNFDNMPDDVKKLTNVQCENCHGPGSAHSEQVSTKQIDVSLNVGVCAQCHDEPSEYSQQGSGRGRQLSQWRRSMHSRLVIPTLGKDECAGCHTAQGFVQRLQGEQPIAPESPEPQSCATCHDPHSAANQNQLRTYGDVTLPNGEVVSAGVAAICHECHNSKVNASDPATRAGKLAPHYATQADMLAGTNAQEYGQFLPDSFHTVGVNGKCVTCHQSETPPIGEPGSDFIGEHTWSMRWDAGTPDDPTDDIENVAGCQICHGPTLTTFDRLARNDYDGNGQTQGIQTEVKGLLTILRNAINESLGDGANPGNFSTDGSEIDFFDANNNPIEPLDSQFFAAYNYFFVLFDGSFGVHNTAYAVQLLQKSYHDLTGNDVPGAVIR